MDDCVDKAKKKWVNLSWSEEKKLCIKILPDDKQVGQISQKWWSLGKWESVWSAFPSNGIHVMRPVPLQEVAGSWDSTSAPAQVPPSLHPGPPSSQSGYEGISPNPFPQTYQTPYSRCLFLLRHLYKWKTKCFISVYQDVVFKNRAIDTEG